MNYTLSIFLILFSSLLSVYGSNEGTIHCTPKWTKAIVFPTTSNGIVTVPHAQSAQHYNDGFPYLTFSIQGSVSKVNWNTTAYAPIDSIPAHFSPISIQTIPYWDKGQRWTMLQVPLLRNTGLTWEKLTEGTITYTFTLESYPTVPKVTPNHTSIFSGYAARTTLSGNSVLSTGQWYKFSIPSDGIYKLDYTFLQNIGINPDNIDPASIQLFGNPGGMLPQANSSARPDDLIENPILFVGDNDNIVEPGEYILFYAQGAHEWVYTSATDRYDYVKNLYDEQNFYFLTFNQTSGKRIVEETSVGSPTQSYNDYIFRSAIENDLTNFIYSGRDWYGEIFNQFNLQRSVTFTIPHPKPGGNTLLTTKILSRTSSTTTMQYVWNGSVIGTQTLPVMPSFVYHPEGTLGVANYTLSNSLLFPTGNTLTLNFNRGSNNLAVAHIDALQIQSEAQLRFNGSQLSFRVPASRNEGLVEYVIDNTQGNEWVWNVTDPGNIRAKTYSYAASVLTFQDETGGNIQEYVVGRGSNFPYPVFIGNVPNQNLHSIQSPNIPDLVIITHPAFLIQAQQLAQHRSIKSGLDVTVVTPEMIYNEFSSGRQDVSALRDFLKMLYDRSTATDSLKYVLLFGDASYDYKDRITANTNWVPTYQSYESLKPLESYSSDDYFALLDDSDGGWSENPVSIEFTDIGVGRLPVRSPGEASILVQKIIHYETSTTILGDWKNMATFIADDGDGNLHLNDAESVSTLSSVFNPILNVNKIYIDAYPQESTPAGETARMVEDAVNRSINEGSLITNYSGHGGVLNLAQEGIVTPNSIANWTNYNHLTFLITATCDFGRFDDPSRFSGAEQSLLSERGGSCGVYTSTRTVFQFSNIVLNESIFRHIYSIDSEGQRIPLGESFKRVKNSSNIGIYNRNYTLLADPSMVLAFPPENIVLTKINNKPIAAFNDTMKALSRMTLDGEVRNVQGQLLANYTGELSITIFDKPNIITTLGNPGSVITNFELQNSYIFIGKATVTNGAFKVTFVVPKDISYTFANGKISLYAQPGASIVDAAGNDNTVVVGGSNPNAPPDNIPPKVRLYINDPSFVNGGISNTIPVFLADVSDDNGINVSSSGVGHEITLQMSGSTDVIVLNRYYTSNVNDFTSGKIRYPLGQLAPGNYTIRFKVWDTYNNSSEETLDFTVVNPEKLTLSQVLNYPNPFSTQTDFHFDHNKSGDNLQVQVQIFTVAGTLIKTLEETFYNAPGHINGLNWNGLDDFGDKIGRGVYVYRIKVRSMTDGSTAQVFQKLVLLN